MLDKIRKTIKEVPRKDANVEAEKGETIVTYLFGISIPEHYKIEGKKHKDGGTPLNVPDGSFVFSDDKKMIVDDQNVLKFFNERKPKTPAEIAKKYDLNTYKAKLIDKDSDQITKITAALMLKNNYEKLAQLALYQEAKKGFKDGIPTFAEDYIRSIGLEPEQLLEIVKGKVNEKVFKSPEEIEEENPKMQLGGDPPGDYSKQEIMKKYGTLFNKWLEDYKQGNREFRLGNINPNLNKAVFDTFVEFAKSKGVSVADVNFVSNNPSFAGTYGDAAGLVNSFSEPLSTIPVKGLTNQNDIQADILTTPTQANNDVVNNINNSEEIANTNLQNDTETSQVVSNTQPAENTNQTQQVNNDTGNSNQQNNNQNNTQNIEGPKGNNIEEKRKWLESEEGQRWLKSEAGKSWLKTEDGKKYKQEVRFKKVESLVNQILPNKAVEYTIGGMEGIANISMLASEMSKFNVRQPDRQRLSSDNVFQPVKGVDRGDYSAAGSTYGQFRPNEQIVSKYTEAIPYQEGGETDDELSLSKISKVITNRNKNLEFVDRAINYDKSVKPIKNDDGSYSTHSLAYAEIEDGKYIIYPTVVRDKNTNKLIRLKPNEAYDYAIKNNEYITVNSKDVAEYYTKKGFKESTSLLEKFEEHMKDLEKELEEFDLGGTKDPIARRIAKKLAERDIKESKTIGPNLRLKEQPKNPAERIAENLAKEDLEKSPIGNKNIKSSNNEDKKEENKQDIYKPKIGRKYYTQDIRNIAATLGQLASIRMDLPWSAPIDYIVPRATYYDPTREIQAASSVANTQGKLLQSYLSPQSATSNMADQQARLAEQVANIVANAQQRNVGIANQLEQQRSSIYNQIAQAERARQQQLYDQTVTARQQYDNAKRKALAGYIAALNQADENAARAYNLSNIVMAHSPFYIDPETGMIKVDPSRVSIDKSKKPDKPIEEKIKETYKKFIESGISPEIAADMTSNIYFGKNANTKAKKSNEKIDDDILSKRSSSAVIGEEEIKKADQREEEEDETVNKSRYGGQVTNRIIEFLRSKYMV